MEPYQAHVPILENQQIRKQYYILKIDAGSRFVRAQPGQFIHVKIDEAAFLRRPFSIFAMEHDKKNHSVVLSILYEVKGKGTQLLARKQVGQTLNIIGPLGHGFEFDSARKPRVVPVLVAGGMGVAPLRFLAHHIAAGQQTGAPKVGTILIGVKSKEYLVCKNEFAQLGFDVCMATEDGSSGFKGAVTMLFKKFLASRKGDLSDIVVFSCGPKPMLSELAKICLIHDVALQVSFEEFMGCGIGACLGCAIETKAGYQRVCHDGPVFNAQDIVWDF